MLYTELVLGTYDQSSLGTAAAAAGGAQTRFPTTKTSGYKPTTTSRRPWRPRTTPWTRKSVRVALV